MHLEDYFDVQAPDDIRLKGHRIGIETILFDYLDGLTPEEIILRYPTISLEEVYATITYYWHRRGDIEAYLQAAKAHETQMLREQEMNPSPAVLRLREIAKVRRALATADRNAADSVFSNRRGLK